MKKNILIVILVAVFIAICSLVAFLYYVPKSATPIAQNPDGVTSPTFTYVTSPAETTKFCDGAVMDSEGYRATLTDVHTGTMSKPNPTNLELIRATIDAATTGMCRTAISQTLITEKDGIVTIAPIDGWAGVSITMCSCTPQVEVNILQIPGMKKVIWSDGTK